MEQSIIIIPLKNKNKNGRAEWVEGESLSFPGVREQESDIIRDQIIHVAFAANPNWDVASSESSSFLSFMNAGQKCLLFYRRVKRQMQTRRKQHEWQLGFEKNSDQLDRTSAHARFIQHDLTWHWLCAFGWWMATCPPWMHASGCSASIRIGGGGGERYLPSIEQALGGRELHH